MTRPLMSLRVDQLTMKFRNAGGDIEALRALSAELGYRKTSTAKALLREVDAQLGRLSQKPSTGTKTIAPQTPDKEDPYKSKTRRRQVTEEAPRTLPVDYELLRKTFSAESELLARWGMTSTIPDDFMSVVFDGWCDRLTDSPDEFGRTVDSAREDRAQLARMRKAGPTATPSTPRRRR